MKSSIKVKQATKKRSEQAYVISARKRLNKAGYPHRWEAPLLGRSVDLVFLKDDCVYSVEFKLHDWKRAFKQARDHQLGADYAYICLPTREVTEEMKAIAEREGLGLFRFMDEQESQWPFETIVEACRSAMQWSVARERLLEGMKGR